MSGRGWAWDWQQGAGFLCCQCCVSLHQTKITNHYNPEWDMCPPLSYLRSLEITPSTEFLLDRRALCSWGGPNRRLLHQDKIPPPESSSLRMLWLIKAMESVAECDWCGVLIGGSGPLARLVYWNWAALCMVSLWVLAVCEEGVSPSGASYQHRGICTSHQASCILHHTLMSPYSHEPSAPSLIPALQEFNTDRSENQYIPDEMSA